MRAEIISIGDELTSGQRLDTNSQWLSERLGEIGIPVMFHTTVADDLEANVRVFREAADRADIVVATGGLGPTADDLTREALAKVLGVELVLDEGALAYIRDLFARRRRDMPERNVVQAMFPAGSRAIHNPHGTAPGIDLDVPRCGRTPARIVALPGVPAEMREMWEQSVSPALVQMCGPGRVIRHRRIKCFGVGESDLEQMLPDLIRRGRDPSVGITVHDATITLRITAAGSSPEACLAAMEPTVATIHQCLSSLVFGGEDDELEHAVARLLRDQNKTLATVEVGTAGLLDNWLGDVPGAADWYAGGIVLPSTASVERFVQQGPHGAAHPKTMPAKEQAVIESGGKLAQALARACRQQFGADLALAVGPFPTFDPQAKEPEKFCVALATATAAPVRASPFAGHPAILKPRAAKMALNLVRLYLLGELT